MNTEENTLALFIDAWPLFAPAAIASAIAGATLGLIGVYVVLRRMVFVSAALSQMAGLGVALTFLVERWLGDTSHAHFDPSIGAVLLTVGSALFVMRDRGMRGGTTRESKLGILFLVGAAGTLAVGTRIVQEVHDIDSVLFGHAVAVPPSSFVVVVITGALVVAIHALGYRGFIASSFDRDGARVRGLPVAILDVTLSVTLAVSISVFTRILGALPVFSFGVLPALAVLAVVPNVVYALPAAFALGAAVGFLGYIAAFLWALPVGAAQTLVGIVVVGIFAAFARVVRR
jgi:zinc transport system permease protein